MQLNNDNTILSKEVINVPLNKSEENLWDNFNLNSLKSFKKQNTVDKKVSHDDKNAHKVTEHGIKDIDLIYNTDDLANSTTSQSLVSPPLKKITLKKRSKKKMFL